MKMPSTDEEWALYHRLYGPTFWDNVRDAVLPLAGALLVFVVIGLVLWAHSAHWSEDTSTGTEYYCRYDPRYGDDC